MPSIHLKYFRVQEHLSKLAQFTNLREFAICLFLFFLLVRFLPGTLSGNSVPSYSFYDDSKVDISNYLDDYRDRNEKLSDIIDQRNSENRQNKVIVGNKRHPVKDKYLIVMYTQVFGQYKFCDSPGQDLVSPECPYRNCRFECGKSKVLDADAVLFSERDLSELGTEDSYEIKQHLQNSKKRSEQVWILYNDEVTANTGSESEFLLVLKWPFRKKHNSFEDL